MQPAWSTESNTVCLKSPLEYVAGAREQKEACNQTAGVVVRVSDCAEQRRASMLRSGATTTGACASTHRTSTHLHDFAHLLLGLHDFAQDLAEPHVQRIRLLLQQRVACSSSEIRVPAV